MEVAASGDLRLWAWLPKAAMSRVNPMDASESPVQ